MTRGGTDSSGIHRITGVMLHYSTALQNVPKNNCLVARLHNNEMPACVDSFTAHINCELIAASHVLLKKKSYDKYLE